MYFAVAGLLTESVRPADKFVTLVPELALPAVTEVSASQIRPGQKVFLTLSNPTDVAVCLTPALVAQTYEDWLGKEREMVTMIREELSLVEEELKHMQSSSARRAKPFLPYAQTAQLYDTAWKIERGIDLKSEETDELARATYLALRAQFGKKDVPAQIKTGISAYLSRGTEDAAVMKWLYTHNVLGQDGVTTAKRDSLQERLNDLIQSENQSQHDLGVGELERSIMQAVPGAIAAIKRGNTHDAEVTFRGESVRVYDLANNKLKELTGSQPGPYMRCTVTEVHGEHGKPLPVFIRYKYRGKRQSSTVPELNSVYVPPNNFAMAVAAIRHVLAYVASEYFASDEKWANKSLGVRSGLLLRAIMPGSEAIKLLYPDEAVPVEGHPELAGDIAARASALFSNGQMAAMATKKIGLPEGELTKGNLERLAFIFQAIAPLVHLGVYESLGLNASLAVTYPKVIELSNTLDNLKAKIGDAKKRAFAATNPHDTSKIKAEYAALIDEYNPLIPKFRAMTSSHNAAVIRLRELEAVLATEYGSEPEDFLAPQDEHVETAIKLLGEDFKFIRKIWDSAKISLRAEA